MARTQCEPGRLGADRGAKPSEAEGFLALDRLHENLPLLSILQTVRNSKIWLHEKKS